MPPKEFYQNQFKPGQSGNPKGNALDRHSTKTFKTRMMEMLEKEIDFKDISNTKGRMSARDALITAILAKGIFKGDVSAAKLIIEKIDGAVEQNVNLTTQDKSVKSEVLASLPEERLREIIEKAQNE